MGFAGRSRCGWSKFFSLNQGSWSLTSSAICSHLISELLGREAALSGTLRDVNDAAERTFFDILKSRGDKLLRYPPPVPGDLSPPAAVIEGVSVMAELIETHNSMMVPAAGSKPEFKPVIAALFDPIITMCERAAEAHVSRPAPAPARRMNSLTLESGKSILGPARRTASVDIVAAAQATLDSASVRRVFLINCLSAIHQSLASYPAASSYAEALQVSIKSHMSSVVEHEALAILDKCNLRRAVRGEATSSEESPEGGGNVGEGLKMLLSLVSQGGVAEFSELQDTRLRNEACVGVAQQLASAYQMIYEASSPEHRSILRHNPEQMRTILGL